MLQAAHRIGSRALKNGAYWAIAAAAFVAIFALNVPFPLIVLAAALVGFIGGRLAPTIFGKADAHRAQSHRAEPPSLMTRRRSRPMPFSAGGAPLRC